MCLRVHASCMRIQARSMRMHTTGLRVCACILVPRNPMFVFAASVLSFILYHIFLLLPSCMVLHLLFLCSHVRLSLYARLGFSS